MRPGDTLADRYRLIDLLNETRGGRFWHAWDSVLARQVAIHLLDAGDPRADALLAAARASARLSDPRLLRVLDAGTLNGWCYVVNEWGEGPSLDTLVSEEPLAAPRAAWIVGEVAELVAAAQRADLTHGRLVPANVMVDETGAVKVIGFAVDAALHGIDAADRDDEFIDLVSILYAALTARWPGRSHCPMPEAPRDHGMILRPRQVRAGVPRVLDHLCDGVLNPAHAVPGQTPHDAAAFAEALFDFVGDRQAAADAEAARQGPNTSPRLPQIPDPVNPPALVPGDDEPGEETQVGLPSFDEEVLDPEWRTPSPEPPPPPPPFEDSPERPLFAPEPANGEPARKPREDLLPSASESSYWPWETDASGPPVPPTPEPDPEPVPGRGWLRVAGFVAVAALVLVAIVYGFNKGRDNADEDGGNDPGTSGERRATTALVTPSEVVDFDPLGDPPEEKPELVALAFDGDPETAWETQGYNENFGPDGLKDGVGLLFDLGSEREVREVVVDVLGGTTEVELHVSPNPERPRSLDDLTRVAAGSTSEGRIRLVPDTTVPERWVVVWLTSLPSDGSFRGRISEVRIRT